MEQSSTSKIKLPNKELVGVKKEKDIIIESAQDMLSAYCKYVLLVKKDERKT